MKRIQGKQCIIHLNGSEEHSPLLDNWEYERLEATDKPKFSRLITCQDKNAPSNRIWSKLLLQNSRELEPAFLLIESTEILFIGAEESLFVLDVPSGNLLFQQKLFAPFLSFYRPEPKCVVALCELEVFAFDEKGYLRWGMSFPDVLSKIYKKGDVLEITELFGKTYQIDASTGKMIHQK